mgnify:CR=1 FL=1
MTAPPSPGARGFGLPDASKETLAKVCKGIHFDAGIMIALNPVLGRENAGENLAEIIETAKVDPATVNLHFNYQALSTMAAELSVLAMEPTTSSRMEVTTLVPCAALTTLREISPVATLCSPKELVTAEVN